VPFTPSHAAAILPFLRSPLPVAALAVGSMVPDLPYFVPLGVPRELSHSLLGVPRELSHSLLGVPVVDLPIGIAVLVLWYLLLRAPVAGLAPAWLRLRLPPGPRIPVGWRARVVAVLWVLLALLVGVATHLVWDAFTHPDGWVVLRLPAMSEQLGPFAVYRWLQYLSSVAGAVIIAVWTALWVARTPRGSDPARRQATVVQRLVAWILVAGSLVVIGLIVWISGLVGGIPPLDRVLVYRTAVLSISSSGVVAVLCVIGWYLLPKRGQPTSP